MLITLTVNKTAVLEEVAQTTSYTGAKKVGDDSAYDRIATMDEDSAELQRFWDESRAEVAQVFIGMLEREGMDGDNYELVLKVSDLFNMTLLPSMQLGMFSYFVQSITGKWYVFSDKDDAGAFSGRGTVLLEEVKVKALSKKMPTRPTYD